MVVACHACDKSGVKLLRCGRCRNVWFCNRECQVVAARQGHSGANCRAADGSQVDPMHAAAAEVAPRMPDAAAPSTTESGVPSASMAAAANSCHACNNSEGKLLCCGQCRNVWFCNRKCQVLAIKLGHKGANCRTADPSSALPAVVACAPAASALPVAACAPAAPTKAFMGLALSFNALLDEAQMEHRANTRIGNLAAVKKTTAAAAVADLIGGEEGAWFRAAAYLLLSKVRVDQDDMVAAARAACAAFRAARASGSSTTLITALSRCGAVAEEAPEEMDKAERESRKEEQLSGSPPLYDRLDLSQISLPTTPRALSRLGLAYNEAAVATCDAALSDAGGRDSAAGDDFRRVPSLHIEAQARGCLGICLHDLGLKRQRRLELAQQSVALMRQAVRRAPPCREKVEMKRMLATWLSNLAVVLADPSFDRWAEVEACLREALKLSEASNDVSLKQDLLARLVNLSGEPGQTISPAEGKAFLSRLNQLYPDGQISRDELHDMPRASRAARRRHWRRSPPGLPGC